MIRWRRKRRQRSRRRSTASSPRSTHDPHDDRSQSLTTAPSRTASVNSNSTNPLQPTIQTDSNYVNIAPFPVFRGLPNECPLDHISRFAKVCRANNVSSIEMAVRIFPVTLENEAALWYDLNIEPYPSLTWQEIKCSFLDAYKNNYSIDSEVENLKQGEDESVRSYFLRLQWLLKRLPEHVGEVEGDWVKMVFVDGLKDELKDWIKPQRPNSLDDALRLAFIWERVRGTKMATRREVKCGFCEGVHEEKDCEVRERMKGLWVKSKEKQLQLPFKGCSNSEEAEEEKEDSGSGGQKKSQCQCSKHQCWKKRLERNDSTATAKSNNAN
ncbi:hypothetical protein NMG60_11032789 [Bertholletia excelsa]